MEEQDRGMPSLFTTTLIQVFVGILLFVALLYGQRDLTILTLLVLGVIGGTRLWTRVSLAGLKWHLAVDKRKVFSGEKFILRISAENAKLLPIWLEMRVPIGDLLQRSSSERVLTKKTSLLWYQRTAFQWELIAERRGVYQLGPLYLLAGDLFSFFSRHQRTQASHSIIVYPRLVPLKYLPLPKRDFFGTPRAKSPVQDPIYILGTRDYQYGQSAKHIHWKASARHQRLQEKVFEPTVQEKVLLAVNVGSFARRDAEESFERTLEIVASMAVRLERQGHSVGLLANGAVKGGGIAVVPIARDYQQLPAILETLARLEMKSDRNLQDLLRRALAETWGVSCVFFSNEADETFVSANNYLAQRQTPVVFVVSQTDPRVEPRPEIRSQVYCLDDIRATKVESE